MFSQLAFGGGVLASEETYPLWQRLIFGSYALCEYLSKCLFPIKLSYLYPFPSIIGEKLPNWLLLYPLFTVLLFSLFWKYISKNKIYFWGILIFIIHIITTLHIIPLSRFVIVADRYAYISSIGIYLILSYCLLEIYRHSYTKKRILIISSFSIYILYLSGYTNLRSRSWYDTDTLKKEIRDVLNTRNEANFHQNSIKLHSINS